MILRQFHVRLETDSNATTELTILTEQMDETFPNEKNHEMVKTTNDLTLRQTSQTHTYTRRLPNNSKIQGAPEAFIILSIFFFFFPTVFFCFHWDATKSNTF